MARFSGTPVKKPRFSGTPVSAQPPAPAAAVPAAVPFNDPGLFMPGTEPTQHAAPPSLVDQIMGGVAATGGVAKQVLHGAATGIEHIVGAPGDISHALNVPAGMPLFGALPTSEDIYNISRLGGILPEREAPQGPIETIARRTGEEAGAALVPVGAMATKAVQMGLPAVRETGGMLKYFLEPFAVDPAKAIAREATVALAAGTGAGAANLAVDRNTPQGQWADLAGALGGAGLYSAGTHILGSVKNVLSALFQNPNYVDEAVRTAVVDRVAKAAGVPGSETAKGAYDTQPLVEQIMRPGATERPSDIIPGFQESLADRTGNPGVAALEYSRQSGPNSGMFTQRRGANTDAVDAAMRAIEPQQTPGAFRTALDEQRNNRLGAAAAEHQTNETDFQRYIRDLSPAMAAEERGSTVRAGLTNAERAAREAEAAIWQGIDGQVDPAPLADTLDATRAALPLARQDAVAGMNQTIDIPRRLSTPAGDIPAGPVDIQELNTMRTSLLDQQRAARSAGDRNQAEALGRFIDDVNGYLGSGAVPADVRAQTEVARGVTRDVNERFNRPNDPIADVLAAKEGRSNVPDSAVASRFVKPDESQASNIDRLLAETDLSSHARPVREALKDEILAGIEKGRMMGDPAALDRYLDRFSRIFDRFPDLRAEIAQAADAGRRVETSGAAQTALQSDLGTPERPGRGPVGKYLQHSTADSERAMAEVLTDKDPGAAADRLLNFVGNDPAAVEGARAAFWQKLKSESQSVDNSQRSMSGGKAWRGDWMKRWLDKPTVKAVFDRLYRDAPEQRTTIEKYAEVLDNVDLKQRAKAPGTSGTAQGISSVLTPETLQSRGYAYLSGRVSGTYLLTSIAAVVARRAVRKAQTEAIERLTDRVLLHPEEAVALLKDYNPANVQAMLRRAKGWLGHEASTVIGLINDGQNDDTELQVTDIPKDLPVGTTATPARYGDPTVDAVMGNGNGR